MSFGYALMKFREERGLSLRELGKLCNIDHAYIHRLEKGEKTAPSEEIVSTISRSLKLGPRRSKLLRNLAGKTVNTQLIELFIEDEDLPIELLEPLSLMSFRGKRPQNHDDWRKLADRLNALVDDLVE